MRNSFVRVLMEIAEADKRVFLLTPDMGFSVLESFRNAFPERFVNTGIAEQNTIGVAAGLAMSGYVVYVYSIIPFVTMRCFEQVRVDLAYQQTNVKIIGVGAGYTYGPAGATHHAIEDIAIMRALPNMTVLCPGDPVEVAALLRQAHALPGPVYMRLGKNGEPHLHASEESVRLGYASTLRKGESFALIATSNMLDQAAQWVDGWAAQGIAVELVSMHTIKPFDREAVISLIEREMAIITLEEHSVIGGLGSAVAEIIAESGYGVPFMRLGIPDQYSHYVGGQMFQRGKFGLLDIPDLKSLIKRTRMRQ